MLAPDLAHPAQTLPNGQRFEVRLAAGVQHTYRIDANRDDPPLFLNVISNNLSCVAKAFGGTWLTNQLIDARGRAVSDGKPTCSDPLHRGGGGGRLGPGRARREWRPGRCQPGGLGELIIKPPFASLFAYSPNLVHLIQHA